MPELPEVETIRRVLEKKLAGRRILKVVFLPGATPASRLAKDLRALGKQTAGELAGKKILGIRRRAKYLILQLSRGRMVFHLGMTGQLFAGCSGQAPVCKGARLPDKHTHMLMELSGGWHLYFRDIRKFGRIRWLPQEDDGGLFQALGPEPLGAGFTPEVLGKALSHKQAPIKALLLNQNFIAGLGNIYADEALFRAGIAPDTPAGRLQSLHLRRLHAAIQSVLAEAIRWRGTTLSDYFDPESRKGGFQARLAVYGQEGKPCRQCGTKIRKTVIAQRGTHWCPVCQK